MVKQIRRAKDIPQKLITDIMLQQHSHTQEFELRSDYKIKPADILSQTCQSNIWDLLKKDPFKNKIRLNLQKIYKKHHEISMSSCEDLPLYPARQQSTIGLATSLYTSSCLQSGPNTMSKVKILGGSPGEALGWLTVIVPLTDSTWSHKTQGVDGGLTNLIMLIYFEEFHNLNTWLISR